MSLRLSFLRRITVLSALVFVSAVLLHAHTKLEKSEPAAGAALTAAPHQIQLWFNETIDVAVSKIELTNPAGKIDLAPPHVMAGKSLMASIAGKMPDGPYTVAWQTAGDDGHVVRGDFTFTVRAAHERGQDR